MAYRAGDEFRQAIELGKIGFERERAARPRRFEIADQGIEVRTRMPAVQRDIVAARVQRARDARADASRGAGDQHDRTVGGGNACHGILVAYPPGSATTMPQLHAPDQP